MKITKPERLVPAAASFYFAQQYFRGKSGWGWQWTSRKARLTMAVTMVAMGVANVADALREHPKEVKLEDIEWLRQFILGLRQRLETSNPDLFGPIDMEAIRRNT